MGSVVRKEEIFDPFFDQNRCKIMTWIDGFKSMFYFGKQIASGMGWVEFFCCVFLIWVPTCIGSFVPVP